MLSRAGLPCAVAAGLLVAVAVTSSRLGIANPLLALFLAALVWAWRRGELTGGPWARPLLGPLAFFVATSLVSAVASLDLVESLDGLPRHLILAFVPLAAFLIDESWWRRFVVTLGIVTTVLAVWGIVQFLQGADNLDNRIQGPMSHYMIYSGWMLLAVLVLLSDLLLRPGRQRWLLLVPTAGGSLAILMSLTRNAWAGLAVGLLLLAAVWRRWLLLAYPAIALVIWLALPRTVLDRAFSAVDPRQHSNYDRLCMAISGVQMVRDYPLTGVGLGMVTRLYPLYRRDDAPRWKVPHLHNNPLQIAAERGLPALGAYLWLLAAFFASTWRALPGLRGVRRAAVASSLVAILGITVAGLFEYNFWSAPVQYLTLVVMGVGVGMAERGPE
ncbi:MAG: O-antigen ligase family protein [Thermoanaerobaculaceae bacterium]|nr:O-antigen ligase family protein [Thermoanaerobaculaceae bacterium]